MNIKVLIPDGNNHRTLKTIRGLACSKSSIDIFVITDPGRNILFSGLCKTILLPKKMFFTKEHLSMMQEKIKTLNIDVLLPISELGIRFVSEHKKVFESIVAISPIPDVETFDKANNKWIFYQFAEENNIDTPKSISIEKFLSNQEWISDFKFPLLLKPFTGEGGQGIEIFDQELSLLKKIDVLKKSNQASNYMIQEFISGTDIDLSALCVNGDIKAYTIQKPIVKHGNNFSFGKIIQFLEHDTVYATAERMLSKLKWSGIIHIDFVIDEPNSTISVLDLNPRFWGSLLGSISAGVNFPYLTVLSSLNTQFPLPIFQKIVYSELSSWEKIKLVFGVKPLDEIRLKNTDLQFVLKDFTLPLREKLKLKNILD